MSLSRVRVPQNFRREAGPYQICAGQLEAAITHTHTHTHTHTLREHTDALSWDPALSTCTGDL